MIELALLYIPFIPYTAAAIYSIRLCIIRNSDIRHIEALLFIYAELDVVIINTNS